MIIEMGELLFCNEPIAALPYYIEGISWNVYSLEELCYYIENNTYLLERDFMTEELCAWIANEIHNQKLAERLRDIMRMDGRLSEYVLAILAECGYCPKESVREILRVLREMEEKSDFECNKVRADRLMEKEKYLSSIYEYKRLLEANDAGAQPPSLIGNIWHNLGTAYARLFLFREAIHCYETAFELNQNPESLHEALAAYRCLKDESGYEALVQAKGLSEDESLRIKTEVSNASRSERMQAFEKELESIVQLKADGKRSEYQKRITDTVFRWKEDYRRICRI